MPILVLADAVIFICLVSILTLYFSNFNWLPYWEKSDDTPNDTTQIKVDTPIEKIEEDFLDRKQPAQDIVNKINEANVSKRALSVAINSRQGGGKTSFLNLMKHHFCPKKNIVVPFNPWLSNSPDAIMMDFFSTLEKEVNKHYFSFSHTMTEFAYHLTKGHSSNFFSHCFSFFLSKNLEGFRKRIKRRFKQFDKKVIVLIDEIDRLEKDEIMAVFRLLRNHSDFPNLVFIVAYDEEYILSALSNEKVPTPSVYLEKFFDYKESLDSINVEQLATALQKNYQLNDKEKESLSSVFYNIPSSMSLSNIRQTILFANDTMHKWQKVKKEVDISHFFKLYLLKYRFPRVFSLIKTKRNDFFGENYLNRNEHRDIRHYILRREGDYNSMILNHSITDNSASRKPGENRENQPILLEKYLVAHKDEISINDENIKDIMTIIKELFAERHYRFERGVNLPYQWNKYFNGKIEQEDFVIREFWDKYNIGGEELTTYLQNKAKTHSNELRYLITLTVYYNAEDSVEKQKNSIIKQLQSIFLLGNITREMFVPHTYMGGSNRLYGFITDKFIAGHSINGIDKIFSQKEYSDLFVNLFAKSKPPYFFEGMLANAIREFCKRVGGLGYVPLTEEQLIGISRNYLKKYCNSFKTFSFQDGVLNKNISALYMSCQVMEGYGQPTGAMRFKFDEIATKIIHKFIKKHIDSFVTSFFIQEDKGYTVNHYFVNLFFPVNNSETPDPLVPFLNGCNKRTHKDIPKIKAFYKAYKEHNHPTRTTYYEPTDPLG